MKTISYITLIFLCTNFSLTAQEQWELIKDKDGIQVYLEEEGIYAFKTFKGITTIDASIHDFVHTIFDLERYPDWGHNVKSAALLERTSDTLQIYYSIAKAPFPYKNRDGVYRNKFSWNPDEKELTVSIEVLDDYLAENEQYIRVRGNGYWKVKVLAEDKLDVNFLMQVDPGGAVPSWLANLFVEDTPFKTLTNIKKTINQHKSKTTHYSFLD
ncbi:MAG: hypothetical protein HON09_04105 [Flavobacteriaceae bacterium]|jgi:hypothetical protein|nr:hypothetical protein [Flavobacteriaceae bacterium]